MWRDDLHAFLGEFQHPAWGTGHSRRVNELALRLAAQEGMAVDPDCLYAAAHLHDLGAMEPYRHDGVDHTERSLEAAPTILGEVGFDPDRMERVLGCIRGHMFYAEPENWPEDLVFHDADTLDFMGYIGITRLLAVVARDEWTPDVRSTIDLIRRFRTQLPDTLATGAARFIAEARKAEMEAFLEGVSEASDGLRFL
ncbi:MAG TPA: HD domain-containing protein [Coriobacteriia bacterium]